jgi:hypothetical protein
MSVENPAEVQAAFNELAKARLADPMVSEGMRTESTLDNQDDFELARLPSSVFTEAELVEFDEAPGSFEDDVLARLENIENTNDTILELNQKTHQAMENIVTAIEGITHQVEPTIALITESKLFRMFVPQQKGKS